MVRAGSPWDSRRSRPAPATAAAGRRRRPWAAAAGAGGRRSSVRRVLDLAAQMAADLVELHRLADLQAARPGEGDADVLDDAAGPAAHDQNAVGEVDGFADGMSDE